jgi:hypothetical protein
MHTVTSRGRWAWPLTGAIVALLLLIPAAFLVLAPWGPWHWPQHVHELRLEVNSAAPGPLSADPQPVSQPVTSVTVLSNGTPVEVVAGPVSRVEVAAAPASGGPVSAAPATESVTESVTDGHLTVTYPACQDEGCAANVVLIVPADVPVTMQTGGGAAVISGVASATVDSGGGPVRAVFTSAPRRLTVSTDGGMARLTVPGGPYALTADTSGGAETVRIPVEDGASRSITVSTGGGPLTVVP